MGTWRRKLIRKNSAIFPNVTVQETLWFKKRRCQLAMRLCEIGGGVASGHWMFG